MIPLRPSLLRPALPATLLVAAAFSSLLPFGATTAAEPSPTITIRAEDQERAGSVAQFDLGESWKSKVYTAHGPGWPVQVDGAGHATVLVPRLARGESVTFTLAPALPAFAASGVDTVPSDTTLNIVAKPYAVTPERLTSLIATYQMAPGPVPAGTSEAFAHGAHLHPVYSPSGKLLTANHPPDHPHQRGIWMSWTKTEFGAGHPDFWNMGKDKSGKLTGEIRFEKLLNHWGGPVHGGFTSTHRWLDHTTGTQRDVLLETWNLTAYHTMGLHDAKGNAAPKLFLLDLVSTQAVIGNEPLKLPKYHYGGLGVRGSALWDAVDKVTMLTANGDDRLKGDGTKTHWVWLGGDVEGTATGIAVLIHPENFRFPQPLRLNPKNPQLCVAPSADGDWSIEPGKPLVLKYRIVLMDSKPGAAELERLWTDYAEPPKVEVK